jgi:3-oxoacyl-[acyl-carrier protein] reductase
LRNITVQEEKMTLWLENRVAIVTGSGQGIGKALAVGLAEAGAQVVTNNRKPGTDGGDAETAAKEIIDKGGQAVPCFGDVSEPEVARKLVQTALDKFGRLDILVSNAAIQMEKSFLDTTLEDYDALLKINLKGPFNCLQAVLPHMIAQKYGRIITISSGSGLGITKGEVAYGTTKAGIECLTKGIVLEVAEYGITLNSVMPVAMTRMQKHALTLVESGVVKAQAGVGRWQDPETISPIVVYLAGEKAGRINGYTFTRRFVGTIQVLTERTPARSVYKDGTWTIEEIDQVMPQLIPETG